MLGGGLFGYSEDFSREVGVFLIKKLGKLIELIDWDWFGETFLSKLNCGPEKGDLGLEKRGTIRKESHGQGDIAFVSKCISVPLTNRLIGETVQNEKLTVHINAIEGMN